MITMPTQPSNLSLALRGRGGGEGAGAGVLGRGVGLGVGLGVGVTRRGRGVVMSARRVGGRAVVSDGPASRRMATRSSTGITLPQPSQMKSVARFRSPQSSQVQTASGGPAPRHPGRGLGAVLAVPHIAQNRSLASL
jgi:hypothetical protein